MYGSLQVRAEPQPEESNHGDSMHHELRVSTNATVTTT